MSKLGIFLLDNLNQVSEEIKIKKPKNYEQLLKQLNNKYKNIEKNYELFILNNENKETIINNEGKYDTIDDILFIREKNNKNINSSLLELYPSLISESKGETPDEKYSCILCSIIIKNENPFLCYKCQKIFHAKCLKDWDEKCKLQNKSLICPNCRNESPIENWNKKLDYEENIKENEDFIDKLCEYKLKQNMNINMNQIKDKKINELKLKMKKQNQLIKTYGKYIEKSMAIFKNILTKINSIHSLLTSKNNNKLEEIIDLTPLNFDNLFENISKVITEELEEFKNYIIDNNKIENSTKKKEIIILDVSNHTDNENIITRNIRININQKKLELNRNQDNKYPNKINLKYYTKEKGNYGIFGEEFVINNRENIDLIINGKENKLVSNYELKRGENIITMIIKNKLINLSHLFSGCKTLKDINDLKYLDMSNIKDTSSMFWGCSSLSDINSLENWDVSNIINFSHMFGGCTLLSDLTPLKNWNVKSGNNFESMFWGCSVLSDLTPLQDWNVSNGKNFSFMFSECLLLSDITPLQNWSLLNCSDVSYMFWGCYLITDIDVTPFEKIKISKNNIISSIVL